MRSSNPPGVLIWSRYAISDGGGGGGGTGNVFWVKRQRRGEKKKKNSSSEIQRNLSNLKSLNGFVGFKVS